MRNILLYRAFLICAIFTPSPPLQKIKQIYNINFFFYPDSSSARLIAVDLQPNPLVLKTNEKVDVTYKIEVLQPLPDKIQLELKIQKKVLWSYINICGLIEKFSPNPIW